MDDRLDHDLVFGAGNLQAQVLIVALDRSRLHLVVEVDPAHHHEDDIDHDVVLKGFVDPDRVGLLGGKARAAKRLQDVARVVGAHEKVDVVRPARTPDQRRGQAAENQEGVAGPVDRLHRLAQNPHEGRVGSRPLYLEDVTFCDSQIVVVGRRISPGPNRLPTGRRPIARRYRGMRPRPGTVAGTRQRAACRSRSGRPRASRRRSGPASGRMSVAELEPSPESSSGATPRQSMHSPCPNEETNPGSPVIPLYRLELPELEPLGITVTQLIRTLASPAFRPTSIHASPTG